MTEDFIITRHITAGLVDWGVPAILRRELKYLVWHSSSNSYKNINYDKL
jgi:hypothetical protein